MDSKTFEYSMKCIPIPSKQAYTNRLIAQLEKFLRRLRWHIYFYKNPQQKNNKSENFGFNSVNSPPADPDLKLFERDLKLMIKNLEFSSNIRMNDLQMKLLTDIKMLKKNDQMLVPADKTSNHYFLKPSDYDGMLRNEITKIYKSVDPKETASTNAEAKAICDWYGISDRVYKHSEKPPFLTIKDHKIDFRSKKACRLINPSNSEIGRMSKKSWIELCLFSKRSSNLHNGATLLRSLNGSNLLRKQAKNF